MSTDYLANSAQTTLMSAIDNAITTITVASNVGFPGTVNFRIRIDNELMVVTAVSMTTWTVNRGAESTTAAAHSAGASVVQVLTAAVMNALTAISGDQSANTVLAGATSGGTSPPAFRALVTADLPNNGVTNAKLRASAAASVIGQATGTSGNPADISAAIGSGAGLLTYTDTTPAIGWTQGAGLPLLESGTVSLGNAPLMYGGTGSSLSSPGADRILYWDQSAGQVTWLTVGSGMAISGTTISATGSGGTVTSVGLTAPSFLTVSGSPITGSGSIALALSTQNANTLFAGPTSGGAAAPTFRTMVTADLPDNSVTYAKMQTTSAATVLLGRGAGSGAGDIQELTLGTGLSISGTVLSASGAGGTVTSVGITPPSEGITVSGSPITTSGNITLALANDLAALESLTGTNTIYYRSATSTWTAVTIGSGLSFTGGTLAATVANQNANTVFAGPTSGSAAAPTFRALATNDLPALNGFTAADCALSDQIPYYSTGASANRDGQVSYLLGLLRVPPGGRLTLTSGTPVTTSDVTGATSVYYTPYQSDLILLWDGTRWVPVQFTETSLSLGTVTNGVPYDVFGYLTSGSLALQTLAWLNATVTITIASPGVVTWNAHGLNIGDPVVFTTTGSLPTGISANTTYYVVSTTSNTFQIATTQGGTAITTSGSQSGTQMGWQSRQRGTAITMQDGRYCKSGDKTRLYLGTFSTTSTTTTEDSLLNRCLWNMYNRELRRLYTCPGYVDDGSNTSYTVTSEPYVLANSGAGAKVTFVIGASSATRCSLSALGSAAASAAVCAGIGFDSASNILAHAENTSPYNMTISATTGDVGATPGVHNYCLSISSVSNTATATFYADLTRTVFGATADVPSTYLDGVVWG